MAVWAFLAGGCLSLLSLTWRFFSVATLQMLQILETTAIPPESGP